MLLAISLLFKMNEYRSLLDNPEVIMNSLGGAEQCSKKSLLGILAGIASAEPQFILDVRGVAKVSCFEARDPDRQRKAARQPSDRTVRF